MKTQHLLLLTLGLMMFGCQTVPVNEDTNSAKSIDYLQYVNPIIGTNGMGHTFPGACAPFGIVQLSPDTDTVPHDIDGKYQPRVYEYCAGYQHKDSTIVGFSHTHFSGTGHSDLGDILVMPVTGEIKFNPGTQTSPDAGYRSRFSHETEIAVPGYYEVFLQDYGVKAQLTATEHAGIHRYTYPQGQDGSIIVDELFQAAGVGSDGIFRYRANAPAFAKEGEYQWNVEARVIYNNRIIQKSGNAANTFIVSLPPPAAPELISGGDLLVGAEYITNNNAVRFSWHSVEFADEYSFVLYDKDGSTVKAKRTIEAFGDSSTNIIALSELLSPGTYNWTVEGIVHYLGKVFFENC